MRALIFMALLMAAISHNQAAEVYRWLDKDGNVHFSDTKPSGQTAEQVAIDNKAPAQPDEGELRRRALLQRAEEDFAYNRQRRTANEQANEAAAADTPDRCKQARIHYGILAEQMPVYWTGDGALRPHWTNDTYQGERRYIDDADREQARDQALTDIYTYCPDPDNQTAQSNTYSDWVDTEFCRVLYVELEAARRARARTPEADLDKLEQEYARNCA